MIPKAIDILLDISSSMDLSPTSSTDETRYKRIVKHLNEIVRPGLDPSYAVGFCVFGGPGPQVPEGVKRILPIEQRTTDDLGNRLAAITNQFTPSGRTPLADAISASCDALAKIHATRRTIIVLSDGGDNGSKMLLSDACKKAQSMSVDISHGGLSVFGIGIDQLDKELKNLAADTGGSTITLETKEPEQEARSRLQDFMLGLATRDAPDEIIARLTIAVEIDRAISRHQVALLAEIRSLITHSSRNLEAALAARVKEDFQQLAIKDFQADHRKAPETIKVLLPTNPPDATDAMAATSKRSHAKPRRPWARVLLGGLIALVITYSLISVAGKQNVTIQLLEQAIELLRRIADQETKRTRP